MTFKEKFENIFSQASLTSYLHLANDFEVLANLLIETNEKYNLTAITDLDGIILRHFADSLTAARLIPDGASVIDVGTGGGFPSLPLAIARRDIKITALDSTAKKLEFVREAANTLSLKNITTLCQRAEDYAKDNGRELYDCAISRAVARLSVLSELCVPLVRVGGSFIALKGADGLAELEEAKKGLLALGMGKVRTEEFTLLDAGERVIVYAEKIKKTDAKYPRPYAKIKKSPLK